MDGGVVCVVFFDHSLSFCFCYIGYCILSFDLQLLMSPLVSAD